jgi:hypothetical protein
LPLFPLIGASHLLLMTVLIFCGGMMTFLVVAACGGLLVKLLAATDQPEAAWTQVGVLGGCALSGAIVLWLVARMPLVPPAMTANPFGLNNWGTPSMS